MSVSRAEALPRRGGVVTWVTTTDHKRIGILYITTSAAFLVVGGLLALLMRAELAAPGLRFVDRQTYAELFTMHGTTMVFLAVAPFGLGLANYLVPLQIGAPDMAFPRLNALSYWLFLAGGLVVYSGFASSHGAAAAGWTAYVPLSAPRWSPGVGMDLWILGLMLTSASGIMTATNLLTTTLLMRAPGMTMWRLPIFTWNAAVTSLIILVAFPPLGTAFALLFMDRRLGGHVFDPAAGGSAVLYQHLFWFFGHPEVYVMILPFFGVITEIVPVFSRKRVFGYVGFVLATLAIAGLSMGVWAHHMFTTGAVSNPFFSAMSFLIAVPTGVKFFNWIGTMWRGRLTFPSPMLFALAFMGNFLIGGVTGVMVASPPIDFHVHDTYFVVAHFHYTLMGGSVFAIFAGIAFWFPKITGYRFHDGPGRLSCGLMFVGFNLTFWPMFVLGLRGMPRRIDDYAASTGWGPANLLATGGSLVLAVSVAVFAWALWSSFRRRVPAGDDPWGGYSLEWATTSPPPEHNFERVPPIRSERPAFDLRQPELGP
ncbi:MAG TPA: cytochrome c oxidase subunit I [Actinomycetota bacterium]|nr:cytochrome c oxidase subunit I [Actinomycetota bacterium]